MQYTVLNWFWCHVVYNVVCEEWSAAYRRWVLLTLQWHAGSWTESRAALGWRRSHSRWTGTSPHADGQCWRDAGNASSPSGTELEAERERGRDGERGTGQRKEREIVKIKIYFDNFSFGGDLWISGLHLEMDTVYEQGEGVKYSGKNVQRECEGEMSCNREKLRIFIKWFWWRFRKQTSTPRSPVTLSFLMSVNTSW